MALCNLITISQCNAIEIRFQRLSLEDKLSGSGIGAIKVISQDPHGFIWVGAEYGLARYDGTEFTRYDANPKSNTALISNYVNDIVFDRDDVMWIASDQGLNRYNPTTDDFTTIQPDRNTNGNNRVAAMAVDNNNNLILARDDGVTVIDASRAKVHHYAIPQYDPVNFISVTDVFIDSDNTIWLGTKGAGAATVDINTGRFRFYRNNSHNPNTIISNYINIISEDQNSTLWFGSYTGGISILRQGASRFERFVDEPDNPHSIGKNTIWDILTDSKGITWVATDHGGLKQYDPAINGFHHILNAPYDLSSLGSNQVRDLFEDRDGDLWVGLFPNGLNFYNRSSEQFQNHTHKPDAPASISHSSVLTLHKDKQGQLWVGTENGLNLFDPVTQHFQHDVNKPNSHNGLRSSTILDIDEDDNGQLWVGTWSGGVHRFDQRTGQFINYSTSSKNPNSISNDFVWSIAKDLSGQLWFGTEGGGLNLYRPETDDFLRFRHNPNDPNTINSDFIWSMMTDTQGFIWIGTTDGLNRFNPQTHQFKRYTQIPGDPTTLTSDRIRSFHEDSRGQIWIGSQDNGLFIYDMVRERFRPLPNNTLLPSQYITGFVEDRNGFIWASSTNGLIKIDPDSLEIQTFDKSHGLVGNNFNREANYLDQTGTIYFGAAEGLTVFQPEALYHQTINYPAVITNFRLFNRPVKINEYDSPIKKAIWLTDKITLTHEHSMFSFDFSALEFRNGGKKEYAYLMEGFDSDWIYLGNDHSATFTNLDPGRYTFKVKAGLDGKWSDDIDQLQINILPPPWRSIWAYILYALILGAIFFLLINTTIKQMQLTSEREINQELKKLNEIKDAFLANTSHELRTPLNGIIGIADALEEYFHESDTYASSHLSLIASSGRRLANLINDILDYSKLANQNLDLHQRPVDMQQITDTVFALLAPLTVNKSIQLRHTFNAQSPLVYADENRLQQILINLVGNAIKYSHQGFVEVGLKTNGANAEIYVQDTGIGIDESQNQAIFEAFNQIQSSNTREYGGTGLGLAITKQLVELHHGRIWLASSTAQGSRFVFSLALSKQQERPDSLSQNRLEANAPVPKSKLVKKATGNQAKETTPSKPRNANDHTILIVDDDAVNRLVLSGILATHEYSILEADSGPRAIAVLAENPQISLIIMDVMMPQMTGFEACKVIREKHPMHELPIVFLTAKKNVDEDLLNCFESGGNDYLTKPIAKNDLLPRIANHLRIRGIIQKLQINLQDDPLPNNPDQR